ncbi:MAG: helix-turn-helix transcriptional regulator [Ramlibacter sp.]|nr:helix-turn-helix transcriptional regulator [Ramlibacter sp.]
MFKTRYSRRYKQFLLALRAAREAKGITQVEVANKLRMDQSWVSKVERGERRLDVVELELWCHAIGIDVREFIASY